MLPCRSFSLHWRRAHLRGTGWPKSRWASGPPSPPQLVRLLNRKRSVREHVGLEPLELDGAFYSCSNPSAHVKMSAMYDVPGNRRSDAVSALAGGRPGLTFYRALATCLT